MARALFYSSLLLFGTVNAGNLIPDANTPSFEKRVGIFNVAPPRETGTVGNPSDYPGASQGALREREYESQIVITVCPEELRLPPKTCDQCGGDSLVHGRCNNILISGRQLTSCRASGRGCYGYYCQCMHDGQDHNPQVTSSTVVDGQTGTVVFEPVTLSDYAKLRHKTTVTVTDVATATESGGSSLETGLIAIFAGGIAWLAICEYRSATCDQRFPTDSLLSRIRGCRGYRSNPAAESKARRC